ncbi:MAG: YceH family protein [Desulfobulbaceae bacterium]|nr:YceH family protein [Desulfobulbaceae bacterium]
MIELELTPQEVRVLGCLLEKEMATPDYYPLSLNALINACNQKSNRNPITSYDEKTVLQSLDALKAKNLAWQSNAARVPKYEHHFGKKLNLLQKEMAIMCLLLLRGPQTLGELRNRTERLYPFSNLEEVSESFEVLEEMELVRQLPKMPGQKESRVIHLLAGEPQHSNDEDKGEKEEGSETTPGEHQSAKKTRLELLEDETSSLRKELEELKQEFLIFRQEFE